MRLAFAYLFASAPMPLKRVIARYVYRWDIHPTAYIGPSVLTVRHVAMGPARPSEVATSSPTSTSFVSTKVPPSGQAT